MLMLGFRIRPGSGATVPREEFGVTGMSNAISPKRRFGCHRWAAISGLFAIALSSGWLTADELADEPAATFFEPYRVPLVSVEVVATDKDGVPIRGLTRDDFQVFEDNVEVEISHFFVSDPELAQNDPVAYQEDLPENFRQNLYLALYFDDTSMDFERRMSALQHL